MLVRKTMMIKNLPWESVCGLVDTLLVPLYMCFHTHWCNHNQSVLLHYVLNNLWLCDADDPQH